MRKVVIFYNPMKNEAQKRAEDLAAHLDKRDLATEVHQTTIELDKWPIVEWGTELAVVFGGDGTFLSAAKQVTYTSVPLLGINQGHLGFLAEHGDLDMEALAKDIDEKNYRIEERTVIKATVQSSGKFFYALNDIALSRSHKANLLHTDIKIDNDLLLHSLRADGIVISTPTGSTAYSLSAGGAVMDPHIKAFQIVPIAAHTLNSRAHVISDEQVIELESRDNVEFFMHADGQELTELQPGEKILVKKSAKVLHHVRLNIPENNFYTVLRDKMKWGLID